MTRRLSAAMAGVFVSLALAGCAELNAPFGGLGQILLNSETGPSLQSGAVEISAVSGNTTEAGGTATFTIALTSQPSANVTIGLSSSDTSEGTVSPATLTFTSDNWNAPQTITITGVDDALADGDVEYSIITADALSDDANFAGLDIADVTLTNTDVGESPGITIGAVSGNTTEAGGMATFTVVLDSEPTANVVIGLTSDDIGEGTVAPASLTFTSANWNAPQTVTITGVDDSIVDGNQGYNIITAAAVSPDGDYNGINPGDVAVVNNDTGDTAGITVGAISGNPTEIGGTATFTVVLDSEPTANVVIGLSSSDTGEGTVSPASLTFTSANWNAPQTVTVTGVDDAIVDGNQVYNIITAAAVSGDGNYNGLNAADVTATTIDNDGSVGVTVSAISGPTSEAGGTATFTVQLNSAPTANVSIALSSSDTGEGTVSPASLTFTSANYASPQTVTVTGVNDALVDGNQPFFIITGAATSADASYNGLDPANVAVINSDNETPGITVGAVTGNTTETGGTANFTVVLNSQPAGTVTIGLSSSDTGEGTVSPANLTFTAANWNAPQTVTITGVDDAILDGNQPYTIVTANATSTDGNYNGMNVLDVNLTNTDNDSPGISVGVAGGDTTEAGGNATFTIVLNSQPASNVVIPLSSSDVGEGTVSPASVTFTTVNWASPQTVTVTGVDDAVQDGNQVYNIITGTATSTDGNYNGLDPDNVSMSNRDDDSPGINVTPTAGLTTTEAGGQTVFNISLNSQPTANVTINLSSSDTGEGTISPASITFTPTNWAAPQAITVTGVDDGIKDGNQYFTITTAAATSGDADYNGLNPDDVVVQNTDDETEGFTITTATLQTTEGGGQATFTVVLNAPPPSNVTVPISSSDTSEGTVSPASLIFTPTNWNAPQTITVTGVNDGLQDGNVNYQVVVGEAVGGGPYDEMIPPNVNVVNIDNDSPGFDFNIDPVNDRLITTEGGGQASFTIALKTAPTANVTINLAGSDAGEGTLSTSALVFTPSNWNAPQTVIVTGADDGGMDGNIDFSIITTASSGDANYNSLNPDDVQLRNYDDDTPGFSINPITTGTRLLTDETGAQAMFTVVLFTAPTSNVTITLSSSDTGEGTVDKTTLVFTPTNWNSPQTVTITGIDDAMDDNDQDYLINFGASTSGDANYNGLSPGPVQVRNLDNDPTPP